MVKSSQYASPPPLSSAKRKKLEDDTTNGLVAKKQRTRVSFSCGECHRRKQKCDRQIPCSHCVARKVPELCKAYTPGKADQDLNARLTRLEQIIEMALPHMFSNEPSGNLSSEGSGNNARLRTPSNEDDNRSQTEEQDPSGGVFQSGKWYGNSASGSVAPASVIEQIEHVAMPSGGYSGLEGKGHLQADLQAFVSAAASQMSASKALGEDLEPSAADNLKTLFQECGVSPNKISELLQELPPSRVSDVLIDFYFTTMQVINWTRYPVSEQEFRSAYESVCSCSRNGIGTANPHDVRFLPLLFVVLAIAVRLAPENIAGDPCTRRVTSLRYYWSSRRSLLIAAAIQPDSLDIVLTRLLSARFLTFDRRITECWSQLGAAVRTAQALGLHRDGAGMQGMSPGTIEYRRRIWSYLYHADRSYALVLGRPNSIQDDYTSTKPPSNIEGDACTTHCPEAQPLSRPTPMTFVILRHQLAEIIGRMVHHFQQVREKSHYSEVVSLDDDLLKFVHNLPPHYSLQPDTSLDHASPYIPVHRFLLITEILFVRISLHRPYMLRRLSSDRYSRSRNACFESAIKDFEVRQAFRETVAKETRDSLSNAYREFQTAMISGIYFILEPNGPYSESMHAILDGFMKDHEGMREMDETTRRELKTIEFLKSKASQLDALPLHARLNTKLHDHNKQRPEQQAQLLLSLQQSVTSPPLRAYSSLSNKEVPSPRSPQLSSHNRSGSIQSPTFARLQHSSTDHMHSPTTSGSPHADDESPAQSLLDTWCHTVSNAPIDMTSGNPAWGGGVGTEMSGWAGITYSVSNPDPRLLSGLDGSDYAYWEALVNQIHRVP
ncbi:hypothetical protein BJ165DRAFT_1333850 [Panaeolus papilionaceus]|nr:hypothetical protein BJ165DRAFT_1333850 [Panaeolus papilionaceus]